MEEEFGSGTRWDVLRDTLMDMPGGLVSDLESVVRFGLVLYSARAGDDDVVVGECPVLSSVPVALDNRGAIDRVYSRADPIDETPTGEAIDAVLDAMPPDPGPDPTIIVLATDGEPDTCAMPNPQMGQMVAVAAAQRVFSMGSRLYIISVGMGEISRTHLQDMANAGLGRMPMDPDAPFWVAGDDTGLRDALRMIVSGVLSCTLELRGRLDLDLACSGRVALNDRPLSCGDPDGWRPVDETHIELLGSSCDMLMSGSGARLQAIFPCDAVEIF
jgi:hypothetical protein